MSLEHKDGVTWVPAQAGPKQFREHKRLVLHNSVKLLHGLDISCKAYLSVRAVMTKRPFSPMNSKPYRNRPAVHIIIRVGHVGISYIGRSKPHIHADTKCTPDAV